MTNTHLTVWSESDCRRVHAATLKVLRETGVEVRHGAALDTYRRLGATVDGTRVRLAPKLVEQALASAPRTWSVPSRGAEATIELRSGNSYFGTGSDCLYTLDATTGERRRVRLADIESLAALCEKLPDIDFVMSMGLPEDAPLAVDDLAPVVAMLSATRKPLIVAPRNGAVLARMREMCAACGAAESLMIYSMPSPPLMHDEDALTKVVTCAELDIPMIYAPAPSCGATAPMSIAAAVVIGNAEVLSGLVLHQAIKPGAPFVYGTGIGAMDMRTAVDAYVVPESFLGNHLGSDLARFYDLPSFNYAAVSDAKALDEQWALEAGITAVLGALSGATILHDVGYLETGLLSSHESIVLGEELVGYARAFTKAVSVDDEALALDEIASVGPGGNHLARSYTRKHLRGFWHTTLLDHTVHDRWVAAGASTLKQRVKEKTTALLAEPRTFAPSEAQRTELARLLAAAQEERERL